ESLTNGPSRRSGSSVRFVRTGGQCKIVWSRLIMVQFSQCFHDIRCADGNPPHHWKLEPVRFGERQAQRFSHQHQPPFADPLCRLAFSVTPFERPVVQTQAMFTGFDELHVRTVASEHCVSLRGDSNAMQLALTTLGIKVDSLSIQNRTRHDPAIVRIQLREPIHNLAADGSLTLCVSATPPEASK